MLLLIAWDAKFYCKQLSVGTHVLPSAPVYKFGMHDAH
jgi:hypothetical protein